MVLKFLRLCDLFEELEQLELADVPLPPRKKDERYNTAIRYWFHNHHSLIEDLPAVLSCLLPEWRTDRVYAMQRVRFTRAVSECLRLGVEPAKRLSEAPEGSDLGFMVEQILKRYAGAQGHVPVTVHEIDQCLADLASITRFSSARVREAIRPSTPHTQRDILRPVIIRLTPRELKWFARIFLKRLDPLQLRYNSVLAQADPLLPAVLKVREDFKDALELLQDPHMKVFMDERNPKASSIPMEILQTCFKPWVGTKIGRPHFLKARSFKSCAQLVQQRRWSIEPKIDGEYCQVHIDLSKTPNCIQIFSKSGKDSTTDRKGVHDWIRQALRINGGCMFERQCILEGEIVVVDIRNNAVLGFEKIRKHVSRSGSFLGTKQDSAAHEYEQLRIHFYDALLVDDEVLIHKTYEVRRERLKQLLPNSKGYVFRATLSIIDFTKCSLDESRRMLERCFQKAYLSRCEGLVLKPADGAYLSMTHRNADLYDGTIIKLKADYIPGLGDTADFAIIGAYSSDKHNVEPPLLRKTKWTHFVLACLLNKEDVCLRQAPYRFKVMGVVSRPSVSHDDMLHLNQHGQFMIGDEHLSYTTEQTGDLPVPEVKFKKPFIVDIVGAKFERLPNAKCWMLRHPRIKKLHSDRSVEDIVSFDELQALAKEANETPINVAEEERRIMERIRKISEPNAERLSPQQSTLPESTSATSSVGTGLSRKSRPPLIRMDSCEMQAGDTRFVSPTIDRTVRNLQSDAGMPKPRLSKVHDNKRKQTGTIESSTVKRPRSHFAENETKSHSNGDRQTANARPLQNINNLPIAALPAWTNTSSLQPSSNIDTVNTVNKDIRRSTNMTSSNLPTRPLKLTGGSLAIATNQFPKAFQGPSPLEEAVVLLSPQVSAQELVVSLRDLLKPGEVVQTIEHWRRNVQPYGDPLGPVVQESQAFPEYYKLAILEPRVESTNAFVEELMKLRLDRGEIIELWDWHALHALVALDSKRHGTQSEDYPYNIDIKASQDALSNATRGAIRLASDDELAAIQLHGFDTAKKCFKGFEKITCCRETLAEPGEFALINVLDTTPDTKLTTAAHEFGREAGQERLGGTLASSDMDPTSEEETNKQ